jgi:hypothetical protein
MRSSANWRCPVSIDAGWTTAARMQAASKALAVRRTNARPSRHVTSAIGRVPRIFARQQCDDRIERHGRGLPVRCQRRPQQQRCGSGPPRASSCAIANRRYPAVRASMPISRRARDAARLTRSGHETRRHSIVAGRILVLSGRVGPEVLAQRPLPPNPVRQRRSEEDDLRAPDATHPAGVGCAEPAVRDRIHEPYGRFFLREERQLGSLNSPLSTAVEWWQPFDATNGVHPAPQANPSRRISAPGGRHPFS